MVMIPSSMRNTNGQFIYSFCPLADYARQYTLDFRLPRRGGTVF